MPDRVPYSEYLEQQRRADLAERRARDAATRDPDVDQALIVFASHRAAGGTTSWEQFRREWIQAKGGTNGR
jgi:hypothetical protein